MQSLSLHRLGKAIRAMRRGRGLTQQAVASIAGVPRRKIGEIEAGSPRVAIESYSRVAHALGGELSIVPARRLTLEEAREVFVDDQ